MSWLDEYKDDEICDLSEGQLFQLVMWYRDYVEQLKERLNEKTSDTKNTET